jgi:hypothetical protein
MAQSRCRRGRDGPSPDADVAAVWAVSKVQTVRTTHPPRPATTTGIIAGLRRGRIPERNELALEGLGRDRSLLVAVRILRASPVPDVVTEAMLTVASPGQTWHGARLFLGSIRL